MPQQKNGKQLPIVLVLNVVDNITFALRLRKVPNKVISERVAEVVEMLGIGTLLKRRLIELSGGERQRVAIAKALISRPYLFLLDEPFSSLDADRRRQLRADLVRIHRQLDTTMVFVTHDQEEAMSISDRVIVMKSGRIIEAGTPIDLYMNPKNIFTANFVGEANFLRGIITQKSDEGSLVDIGEGLQLMTKDGNMRLGDRVVIALRPEYASIGNGEMFNRLSGKVVDIIYSGSIGRVKVKLVNGDLVIVKMVLSFERPVFRVGDDITINVSPKNILVYPYPEKGLDKELTLE